MARRAAGEHLPDSLVTESNADLMPDLAKELSILSLLERARLGSSLRSLDGAPGFVRSGPSSVAAPPIAPDAFEGYELGGEVHRGGQGVVYEARQLSTGRRVAVKVMREGAFAGDDRDAARFEREVRILGQLEHPGIVGILASGVHAGHFYYVMDFVAGVPLDRYAAERCSTARERLEVFLRVCEAVSAAHLRGIIHRDLKPANILVDDRAQPRILDFGLARVTAEWAASAGAARRMTHTGHFVGSMPWASPEQAMGDPDKIDIRTDIYSLGVVLYQMLAGRFPYRVEGGPRDVLDQILTAAPARLRSVGGGGIVIDEDLEAVVLKCLAKERERRYQSAGELAEDVRRYLSDRPVLARPPSAAYQVRSFVRRNRALVIGAAAVGAALVLGLVGTTIGLVEASSGRFAAESARDAARRSELLAHEQLEESQRLAYAASIAAADSALRAGDVAAAQARLAVAPPALRSWEWSFLRGRLDQSAAVLDQPRVLHAAVSADGGAIAEIAVDGAGGRVRVLDAGTLQPTWEAPLPREAVSEDDQIVCGFSRDSRLLATAHGSLLLVWRVGEGAPITRVGFPGTTWGFTSAVFSPSGDRLFAAGREGRLAAWEIPSGTVIGECPEVDRYFGIQWSHDSVLTGTSDGPLEVDPSTLTVRRRVLEESQIVPELSGLFRLSPDGSHLAIARGTEVLFGSSAGTQAMEVLRGHTQYLGAIAFSPDGRRLATAGWDRAVRVWDVSGAHSVQERVLIGHTGMINSLGFLGSGSRMISSARDGSIRIWDLSRPAEPPPLQITGVVQTLRFTARGDRLFAASAGEARCWDAGTGSPVSIPQLPGVSYATMTADGARVILPMTDGTVKLLDAATRAEIWTGVGHSAPVYRCLESPDGRMIASAGGDPLLRLRDAQTGATVRALEFHDARLGPLPPCFSPDSRLIALPVGSGAIVWDCASGRQLGLLQPETSGDRPQYTLSVAFSPDGSWIVTGDSAGVATIWDARTLKAVRRLAGMEPGVWSVAFDPSGGRLATGSQDRTIRIWDPQHGQEILVLRGHTGTIMALAWSPDGRTLASGAHDGIIKLWSTADARP